MDTVESKIRSFQEERAEEKRHDFEIVMDLGSKVQLCGLSPSLLCHAYSARRAEPITHTVSLQSRLAGTSRACRGMQTLAGRRTWQGECMPAGHYYKPLQN